MTPEDAAALTSVGRGTPMGELFRRYWLPIATTVELEPGAATAVRVLGEDLALFRTIKPNLSAGEERRLQDGFRAVGAQQVALTVTSIDHRGDTATVVANRRDTVEIGGRRQVVEARQTLSMARVKGTWVITDIR